MAFHPASRTNKPHPNQQQRMSYAIELAAWRLTPFASDREMMAAISSPEYRLDSAYRLAVEAKIARTSESHIGIKTRIHENVHREDVGALDYIDQTAAGIAQQAEWKEAEQELAEIYGPSAVQPGAAGLAAARIRVDNSGVTRATVETQ